jgi:hypothetical protein
MRDGRVVDGTARGGLHRGGLVEAMGHVAARAGDRRASGAGPEVVATPEGLRARRGEIVGSPGWPGTGRPRRWRGCIWADLGLAGGGGRCRRPSWPGTGRGTG